MNNWKSHLKPGVYHVKFESHPNNRKGEGVAKVTKSEREEDNGKGFRFKLY